MSWRKCAEYCIDRYMATNARYNLSRLMKLWFLSHSWPAKAQVSLCIRTVSPEPSLFAHMKYENRRRVRPKIRHLAPLDDCTCAFEEWVYGGQKLPSSPELAHLSDNSNANFASKRHFFTWFWKSSHNALNWKLTSGSSFEASNIIHPVVTAYDKYLHKNRSFIFSEISAITRSFLLILKHLKDCQLSIHCKYQCLISTFLSGDGVVIALQFLVFMSVCSLYTYDSESVFL